MDQRVYNRDGTFDIIDDKELEQHERSRAPRMGNDAAKTNYMQQLVGYWLTGSVEAKILPMLWGDGDNGKSVFIETMQALLGEYASAAPRNFLVSTKHEQHPAGLAFLFRKRFISETETDEGVPLSEPLVKQLTGMDSITARRMREDFWSFAPTHKLAIATNSKPRIRGTDNAIWNRVKLIPFTVTIPRPRQDPRLLEKLKGELPGILNWALVGCKSWQADGFIEPDEVQAATAAYRSESDNFGTFVAEYCVFGADMQTTSESLFLAYSGDFGGKLGKIVVSKELLKRYPDVESVTFNHGVLRGKRGFTGVGLRTSIQDDSEGF